MAIITQNKGTLEYLAAQGIAVPHGFTTRFGGVSRGSLESLNLGAVIGSHAGPGTLALFFMAQHR